MISHFHEKEDLLSREVEDARGLVCVCVCVFKGAAAIWGADYVLDPT